MTWCAQVRVETEPHTPLPVITGRQVASVVIATLLFIGFGIAVGSIIFVTPMLLAKATELPRLYILLVASVLQCAAMVGAVYWIILKGGGLTWRSFGFAPPSRKQFVVAIVLGVALVPVMEGIERLAGITLGDTIVGWLAPDGFTWTGLVGGVLLVGIATPIAEEVLFRGVIYAWMRTRWSMTTALLLNGALFGVIHLQYPAPYLILVGLLGIAFALAYEKTGSLWVPSLMHAGHNSAVIIAVYWALP